MLETNWHCRTDFEANYFTNGCGALKEILYISQYGDVMSCPFIQVSFGNILQTPLKQIRERGLRIPEFATFAKRCLIARDPEFINRYLAATADAPSLPVSIEHFEKT